MPQYIITMPAYYGKRKREVTPDSPELGPRVAVRHRLLPVGLSLPSHFCLMLIGSQWEKSKPAARAAESSKLMKGKFESGSPVIEESKPAAEDMQPVPRICLRCSKRVNQCGESTSRGKMVPVGYLCDLGPFHKCSYCSHTKHDCESVGLSLCVS